MTYANRRRAGVVLAGHLTRYAGRADVVVLGLVRGGVPVAAPVAALLGVGLDAMVVRKLGVPWAPEVAFGALGPGGVVVHNPPVEAALTPHDMTAVVAAESVELARREALYRGGRPAPDLTGRVTVVVDDGLATGATAAVAVAVARRGGAARVVLAVPVGPPTRCAGSTRWPTRSCARCARPRSARSAGSTGSSARPPTPR